MLDHIICLHTTIVTTKKGDNYMDQTTVLAAEYLNQHYSELFMTLTQTFSVIAVACLAWMGLAS
jgi:hypothetical protein